MDLTAFLKGKAVRDQMSGPNENRSVVKEHIRGLTILVVEDEALTRTVIADELRLTEYNVIEASNSDEALDVLHARDDVKLVFSDVLMPGSIDGAQLAGLIGTQYRGIKVVLTSGHVRDLRVAGAESFIAKPYEPLSVISHIRKLLVLTVD
jgi:two-component system, response regulator PdtaR